MKSIRAIHSFGFHELCLTHERYRDLGGETFQKAFVNRAGSVYSERDAPRLSGSRGAIEWRIDALVP